MIPNMWSLSSSEQGNVEPHEGKRVKFTRREIQRIQKLVERCKNKMPLIT